MNLTLLLGLVGAYLLYQYVTQGTATAAPPAGAIIPVVPSSTGPTAILGQPPVMQETAQAQVAGPIAPPPTMESVSPSLPVQTVQQAPLDPYKVTYQGNYFADATSQWYQSPSYVAPETRIPGREYHPTFSVANWENKDLGHPYKPDNLTPGQDGFLVGNWFVPYTPGRNRFNQSYYTREQAQTEAGLLYAGVTNMWDSEELRAANREGRAPRPLPEDQLQAQMRAYRDTYLTSAPTAVTLSGLGRSVWFT